MEGNKKMETALLQTKKVFHPACGWVTKAGIKNKKLGYYFDPEYGDWLAPTTLDHDAVAGVKSWKSKNPLIPENTSSGPEGTKTISNIRETTWRKKNPLVPTEEDTKDAELSLVPFMTLENGRRVFKVG